MGASGVLDFLKLKVDPDEDDDYEGSDRAPTPECPPERPPREPEFSPPEGEAWEEEAPPATRPMQEQKLGTPFQRRPSPDEEERGQEGETAEQPDGRERQDQDLVHPPPPVQEPFQTEYASYQPWEGGDEEPSHPPCPPDDAPPPPPPPEEALPPPPDSPPPPLPPSMDEVEAPPPPEPAPPLSTEYDPFFSHAENSQSLTVYSAAHGASTLPSPVEAATLLQGSWAPVEAAALLQGAASSKAQHLTPPTGDPNFTYRQPGAAPQFEAASAFEREMSPFSPEAAPGEEPSSRPGGMEGEVRHSRSPKQDRDSVMSREVETFSRLVAGAEGGRMQAQARAHANPLFNAAAPSRSEPGAGPPLQQRGHPGVQNGRLGQRVEPFNPPQRAAHPLSIQVGPHRPQQNFQVAAAPPSVWSGPGQGANRGPPVHTPGGPGGHMLQAQGLGYGQPGPALVQQGMQVAGRLYPSAPRKHLYTLPPCLWCNLAADSSDLTYCRSEVGLSRVVGVFIEERAALQGAILSRALEDGKLFAFLY
jgi:hypothetical protein